MLPKTHTSAETEYSHRTQSTIFATAPNFQQSNYKLNRQHIFSALAFICFFMFLLLCWSVRQIKFIS